MSNTVAPPPPPPPPPPSETPEWERAKKELEKLQQISEPRPQPPPEQPYGGFPPPYPYFPFANIPPPMMNAPPNGFSSVSRGRPIIGSRFSSPGNYFNQKRGASSLLPTPTTSRPSPAGGGIRFKLQPKTNVTSNTSFQAFGHGPAKKPRQSRFAPADDSDVSNRVPPTHNMSPSHQAASSCVKPQSDGDSGKENNSESSSNATGGSKAGVQAEWSPSLKAYVSRCFAQCKTDIDKDVMEKKLRERLTQAFEQGSDRTNWDIEPLPLVPSNCVSFAAAESGPLLQGSPSAPATRGSVFGIGNRLGMAFGSGRGGRGRWGGAAFGRSSGSRSRSRSPYSRGGRYGDRHQRRDR